MNELRTACVAKARADRRLLKLGTVLGSGAAAAALLMPAAAFANLPARPPSTPPASTQPEGAFSKPVVALLQPATAFEIDRDNFVAQLLKKVDPNAAAAAAPTPQDLTTVLRPRSLSASVLPAGNVYVNDGDITTTADNTPGISTAAAGNTVITAGNITTSGNNSAGITALGGASISINAGNITTYGTSSVGVAASTTTGVVAITTGNIKTFGDGSTGVSAKGGGAVAITTGDVSTIGTNAGGIYATSSGGAVTIQAGVVSTEGDYATAITAKTKTANGDVTITASDVSTHGNFSDGVYVRNYVPGHFPTPGQFVGDVTVTADQVSTTGAGSPGIFIWAASADVTVNRGVDTYGPFSSGIVVKADSSTGEATIHNNGSVHAHYAYSQGIYALAGHGGITIDGGGNVTTEGASYSAGVVAVDGYAGSITINQGTVQTKGTGKYDDAIFVMTQDFDNLLHIHNQPVDVTVNVQGVSTYGAQSRGIVVDDGAGPGQLIGQTVPGGQVNINVQDSVSTRQYKSDAILVTAYNNDVNIQVGQNVSTRGDSSNGIDALGRNLTIGVGGTVSTQGDNAAGIVTYSSGDVHITTGSVQTAGNGSYGIVAIAPPPSSPICQYVIGCTGPGGAVTISAGSVATAGKRAFGIYAFGYAGATINVGSVATQGDGSSAIIAKTYNGPLAITETGGITTQGQQSAGVVAEDANGPINLTLTGAISTQGGQSPGVIAADFNGPVNVQAGTITTAGASADALVAYSFAGSATVNLGTASAAGGKASAVMIEGQTGVTLTANQISTSGDDANALIIRSGGYGVVGDATVNVGSITTTGQHSAGVDAFTVGRSLTDPTQTSTLSINVGSITTSGIDSPGISALNPDGAINITASNISTQGYESTGVLTFGGGAIDIQAGSISTAGADAIYAVGAGSGTITLGVSGAVASSGGNGAVLVNTAGATNITVASTGSVSGAADAIQVQTGGGPVTVSNAGVITGGTGFAINVTGLSQTAAASTQIDNTGTIVGAVNLAGGGNNTLTNAGTFVATKDSDFGGGNSQFVNTGVLKIAPGAAGAVNFLNLATFQNAGGLVDLRNGHAGDVFTLSGDYVASGNARLGLDVNGTTADKLVIQGTATGATTILLNGGNPASATLLAKPVTLVQAGAGSTGTFKLSNANIGLIHYGLTAGSAAAQGPVSLAAASGGAGAPVTYTLTASAGAPVYGTLKLEESAQNIWRQSADAWSEHLAAMRGDAMGGGTGQGGNSGYGLGSGRYWVQAYGSTSDRNQTVGGFSASYNQTDAGVQAGADLARTATRLGTVGWGVTAGYTNSQIDSQGATLKSDIDTFNFGGYAVLNHGPYFANGLVKFDHHQISTTDSVAGYQANLNGNSYGAQFEVGRHYGTQRWAFEPTVSLTYVRTSLDNVSIDSQTLAFDDEDGLSAKIGGRFYANRTIAGTPFVFYAGAAAVDDFTGSQRATFYSGGTSQNVSAGGEGAYAQAVAGVSARTVRDITLYLEGDANFGGSRSGAGLRFGARF